MSLQSILSIYTWTTDIFRTIIAFLMGAFFVHAWYNHQLMRERIAKERLVASIRNVNNLSSASIMHDNDDVLTLECMNSSEIANFVTNHILPVDESNQYFYAQIRAKWINAQINGKLFLQMTDERLKFSLLNNSFKR